MAPERRTALIAWAQEHDATIIEDDYDAEHRYDRDPVGALQGHAPEQVVYGGTASKTLAPRCGWAGSRLRRRWRPPSPPRRAWPTAARRCSISSCSPT